MSESARNYRVGMEGASTLLGKEILAVLKARSFPVAYVVGLHDSREGLEAPILNIGDDPIPVVEQSGDEGSECDFLFRAGRQALPPEKSEVPHDPGTETSGLNRCFVIDARAGGNLPPDSILWMPWFDDTREKVTSAFQKGTRYFPCPHAASLALAGLVLRLAASIEIRHISAFVLVPASEFGPDAVDELQRQTIGLLNFGEVPKKVFGAQTAFNVSPRLGGRAKSNLAGVEARVRGELVNLLAGQAPVPAVRLAQAPSFYSMAFSIYAQSPQQVRDSQVEQALSGKGVEWMRSSQPSASPVDVQGSATLLLDPVMTEAGGPGGFWLWGRVDDLRLEAENTVAMAEQLTLFVGES